ncbi:MAG: sulfite exporter TauE/SafE family protein [Deltaproteobacteria bacterium]|nr:sulfite exporter TauE/SafE family protein [Deltaproteobacteria bacterium]
MTTAKQALTAHWKIWLALAAVAACSAWGGTALAAEAAAPSAIPDWAWPIVLFLITMTLGILAVMGGLGGAVLFVPIASSIFPSIHMDFIRGAGLMMALTGALAAGPGLIRQNLASLRLAIPVSLVASTTSILGAMIGLALPANLIQILLGVIILAMSMFMYFSRSSGEVSSDTKDPLALALGIKGEYQEDGKWHKWAPRNMITGLVLFSLIGLMAGMFGIGAGWANVPVLNVVMGVPLKISVATSYFLLAITDTSAAWVYINRGALLPYIVIPAVIGIMIGAKLGVKVLSRAKPAMIKKVVITLLLLAGARALLKGLGI